MAAVDRRTGMVRRGTTPTAPKPMNLPSQKLESQGLVPDVEIVPRGTFCWGSAGRSVAASNKNNEGTDLGSLPSESTGAGDNETKVQNALVSTDKLQGLAERPSPLVSEESSASPASSTACITLGETTVAHSISEACNSDTKTDSRSPPASDAGSFPDSIARPSSSESSTATPMTFNKSGVSAVKNVQVEEQRKSNGFPIVGSEDSVKGPNLQPKLGTHDSNESLPGSQDFGYFEGFYSNQQAFSRSGMSYSNGPGMTFGPGMHSEPSQHTGFYSFLGVPYYDSTKDKEIVVITMVGNPGFHGSYLPHPGFPDQYGRPGVYGNFPLQFGHFENFGVPGHDIPDGMPSLSADMNPMCLGEQGEFACYEQEYYKDSWVNKCSVGEMQRSNGAHLPTSFSTFKSNLNVQDYSMPRRSGGHKFPYRNKKAASSTVFTPERRVTLLTKVSQHEVVISSLQKKSRRVENGEAVGLSSSPSFAQNTVRVDEVVDVEKSHALDTLKVPSMSEMILDQATSTGSNNEGSILVSSCNNDNLRTAFDSSSTLTSTTSTSISQAHGKPAACHEDTLAANCPGAVCQVLTAPSTNLSSVIENKARPKREVRHVTFNVADHIMNAPGHSQDVTLNVSTESTASMEQVNEHVSGEETLSSTTAASMPCEHNQGSIPVLLNQKAERKWRRKAFVAVAKPGQECSKGEEDVMDKKALSLPSPSDKARDVSSSAGADSLPISTMGGKPESHCSVSLSSSAAAALSGCEAATLIQGDYTEPDRFPKVKKSKKVHKRGSENGDRDSVTEISSVQILESSKKRTMRTIPFVDSQTLDSKRASCGFGKAWRLKHPGDKAATKVLKNQASMASTTSKIPGRQVTESCLINNQIDPKHRLEVSCDDNSKDKFKQEQTCCKHSHEDMQNKSCNRLSDLVDKEHTSRNMSLNCVNGIDNKNLRNEGEKMEGCKSGESLPLGSSRVEERAYSLRLVGKQKLQQEGSPASKLEEPKHAGRVDIPMRVEGSPASKLEESKHAGRVDIPMRVEERAHSSRLVGKKKLQQEVSPTSKIVEPKHAGRVDNKFKDLTSEVNQSSKAASGLPQQSSLRNCQEQPVKYVLRMRPYDKSNAENKQYGNSLQGASGVIWKPKKSPVVQMSIEGSLEGGKDNPSTPASQKKKTSEELPVLEAASSAPMSRPCGNGQQVRKQAFRKPVFQVREASEMCPVVTSTSSAQLSPACGNEQQVNNMGKQGSVPPVSPSKQARDEGPVVTSPSCTLSSPACGNAQDVGDMVKRAPVKPASQLKMGYEDCPVVISFSSASLASPCGNGQEVANTVKQSYKAALERQHPALSRNLTSSEEQAGPGPISQPVSSLSMSLKLEDTTINKSVKPRGHHTSWRPKAVSGSNAAKAAYSKEVKENDPSASIQVERAPKKHTHPLPSSKSAELSDLHVWKNNGRHPVRASYGLPYWRKEYPQQQKSVGYRAKLHAESASSPEHQNRANEKLLEREFPRGSLMKEVKHARPQMQAEMSPSREHPNSYSKFSQHHAYLAKQVQSNCNQHNAVGNCRPFSKKPNFSHDNEKKIVHYQQPLSRMCTPVEQGNRRPFSTKSNFSYDDNTKVHQQSLARISMHMEQGKVRENFSIRGIGHLEGACPSRNDNKPAKRGRFRNGWKVADFDRKGWVAKPETRC